MLMQAKQQQDNVEYAFDRLMDQLGQQAQSLNETMVSETTKEIRIEQCRNVTLTLMCQNPLWDSQLQLRLVQANQDVQNAIGPFKSGIKKYSDESVRTVFIGFVCSLISAQISHVYVQFKWFVSWQGLYSQCWIQQLPPWVLSVRY